MDIDITERGWSGHYCASSHCRFNRNTSIKGPDICIIVSTVGNKSRDGKPEEIGYKIYYETVAFRAKSCDPFAELDASAQIDIDAPWHINRINKKSDIDANNMHEKVVLEISKKISTGVLS